MREDVLLAIIMDCRTSTAIELRYKLGFKKHDSIITKELSVLTKTMKTLTSEKILLHHYILVYQIDMQQRLLEKRHKDTMLKLVKYTTALSIIYKVINRQDFKKIIRIKI